SMPTAWQDGVYLSDTPTYDPSTAILVATFDETGHTGLAAVGNYTEDETVTLPEVTVGNRYLLFVTDPLDVGGAALTLTNVKAVPITLTAPDLAVTSASAQPTTALLNS